MTLVLVGLLFGVLGTSWFYERGPLRRGEESEQ